MHICKRVDCMPLVEKEVSLLFDGVDQEGYLNAVNLRIVGHACVSESNDEKILITRLTVPNIRGSYVKISCEVVFVQARVRQFTESKIRGWQWVTGDERCDDSVVTTYSMQLPIVTMVTMVITESKA